MGGDEIQTNFVPRPGLCLQRRTPPDALCDEFTMSGVGRCQEIGTLVRLWGLSG